MYGSIIRFADKNLSDKGSLYLELHENYSDKILDLFDKDSWSAHIKKDYDKKPRFIIAKRR
jgi:release factor glutamine methyltransferase